MGTFIDLAGQRFGSLTALCRVSQKSNTRSTYWACDCDCGSRIEVESFRLRSGRTASCGCKKGQRVAAKITRHGGYSGDKASPTVKSWRAMISRCCNPANRGYIRYGGRGISVCERWFEFSNFLADMGERPEGKTLERIDGSKGYCPDNCRWATPQEQQQNIKNNRHVSAAGEILTIRNASIKFGLEYQPFRTALYVHGHYMVGATRIDLLPLTTA